MIVVSTINRRALHEKPPPQLGARRGHTGYGARVACDQGRCRSQWPAGEVKRHGCSETRRRFEQHARFLSKGTSALKDARILDQPIDNLEREELCDVHKRGQMVLSDERSNILHYGCSGFGAMGRYRRGP
jgi:hypothetical protein